RHPALPHRARDTGDDHPRERRVLAAVAAGGGDDPHRLEHVPRATGAALSARHRPRAVRPPAPHARLRAVRARTAAARADVLRLGRGARRGAPRRGYDGAVAIATAPSTISGVTPPSIMVPRRLGIDPTLFAP